LQAKKTFKEENIRLVLFHTEQTKQTNKSIKFLNSQNNIKSGQKLLHILLKKTEQLKQKQQENI